MSQSVEEFSELNSLVDHIAALLVEMNGDLQEKATLIDISEQIETLIKEAHANDISPLIEVADWWKKLVMASLLDQANDSEVVAELLNDFCEQASLLIGFLARGVDKKEIAMGYLIERAANCLGIEYNPPSQDERREPEEDSSAEQGGEMEFEESSEEKDLDPDGFQEEASSEIPPEKDMFDLEDVVESETIDDIENSEEIGPEASSEAEATSDYAPEVLDYSDAMFDESLIYDFIDECESHLDDIEEKLLALENEPENISLVDEVFRPIHSIKGSAGFLGVKVIQDFAHETENLLDEVRKGRIPVTTPLTETTIEAGDILKTMLSQLRTTANRALGSDPTDSPLEPLPTKRVLASITALMKGGEIPKISSSESESQGEETTSESVPTKLGEILISDGSITEEQLEEALDKQERPLGQVLLDEGLVSEEKVNDALQKQSSISKQPRGAIKVDIEKLDNLVNLVGELVINQTLVQGRSMLHGGNGNGMDPSLLKDIDQLGKITKEMQDQVMSLRMVPLRPVFQKMNRVVRDVSKKAGGKKVQLVSAGEDTEVDKTVSEIISDPLVHIIRNAADHGIELPEERKAAGKDETGTVRLSAYHEGGNIVIEIQDDGKGLNREKILDKAVSRGLAEPDLNLTDAQIYQFVMSPGFSTAEKVTDISGRGVGLDVVKKNIEQLRGRVDIQSVEGQGTTFTIKLPLTLAIIDGMVVRVGKEKYILPTLSIIRSFRPAKEELSTVHQKGEMLNVRGELMPLVRLHQLHGTVPTSADPTEGLAVIVENEGKNYTLLVDELLNQQHVVIKSLGPHFKGLKGIAGGTILGDGSVGLILDIAGIFEAYKEPGYGLSEVPVEESTVATETIVAGSE